MKKNRTTWQEIVSKAYEESAPKLDVTNSVQQRIAQLSIPPATDWATWSAAGCSVAAAALMMLTASLAGVFFSDPFGDWFSSFFLVMT